MKKVFRWLIGMIILLMVVAYAPQLVHICTDCETFFIGAGYYQNILVEAVSDEDGVLCKNCAENQHALAVGLGRKLDEYKRPVEWNPLTVIQQWVD